MTISSLTTGYQLSLLCTGDYTRVGDYWVWIVDDMVHISDTIGASGCKVHRIGGMDTKLCNFKCANGMKVGRDALIDTGYSVSIEDNVLYARLGKEVIAKRDAPDDRYHWLAIVRGWRAARLHSQGVELECEDYWWKGVRKIEYVPPKEPWEMTKAEMDEYNRVQRELLSIGHD